MEKMEDVEREEKQEVLRVLEVLKEASRELQSNPSEKPRESKWSAINALLELESESDTILSDPQLSQLSQHLSYLKTHVHTFHSSRSFLRRRLSIHQISRVAESIESEIQAWIDREFIHSLLNSLHFQPFQESHLITLFTHFHLRLSQGFNRQLQDLVLKAGLFSELETILINPSCPITLREQSAFLIEALISFNKNVFVGQVFMGPTIKSLISMSSVSSLKVLCSLIKSIKSPLVDEIEANKGIPTIISFLISQDLAIQVLGFDCVLEIGYFGRKEAIEAMMKEDIVKILVELQRSQLGGDLIEVTESETEENRGKQGTSRERYLEKHPFASCVARFAVQLEVGEGLRQREKRGFKQQILTRVKVASVSDAQAATVLAEVLWGSFS